MQRRFRFISPFFLFLLASFMFFPFNVEPSYALGQAGWELVKDYTFTGSSLNLTEWDIWKSPATRANDPVIVDNKLKLSIPDNVGDILYHPECDYVCGIKSKLMFTPSMKIWINASFENAVVPHQMIGFWVCHDTDEGRNEVAFEYHGSWKVYGHVNEISPSVYYKAGSSGDVVTWYCRYGCPHYANPCGDEGYNQSFTDIDYWHGWHVFEIDIGYYNTTHKYIIHYIDGVKVFDSGLKTRIPTLPMYLFLDISVPAWDYIPPSGAYILIDRIKVYYWMDKLDNGGFEDGMNNWVYKNFQAVDYDSDGDKKAQPTNLAEYWFGQQICYAYENLMLTWKLRLILASTGGIVRFWFKNPYDYNMSLALIYVGNGQFEVKWSIITPSQYVDRINYYSLPFNQWLDCYFRKDGSLLEYKIGDNKLAINIPELAKVCVASFIGLDGYQQNFLVDEFNIAFNILSANYATVKLTSIGAGEILPEKGFYIVQKNSTFTISSYPLNSSYYTKWNIKSETTNYNVTCQNLNLIIDKDYEITAYFVFGIANKTYQINYVNLWWYGLEYIYGYKIDSIKGSTNPSFGVHDNPGIVQQLAATAFSDYFFYRWIGRRENGSITYFPVNQNVISVNFSETPYWTSFRAVFASAKIIITLNVDPSKMKIDIYDNGTYYPLNFQVIDSTSVNIYLKKGVWKLRFSAEGYYSQTITLTVDQITETLCVVLMEIVAYNGGGGGGGGFPKPMSKIYIYELTIQNPEFSAYLVWGEAITISPLQNKNIYLKVTVHLDYPIVEIYTRNITDMQINVPTLYSMLGYSVPKSTFFAIVVDSDATLTVHAALPSQPKECWKTKPNSVHPIKIGDWTWDDGVLTFTVYSEDPAFSFIYASPGGVADLTNTLIMVAVSLAMMSVIVGMIRKWIG